MFPLQHLHARSEPSERRLGSGSPMLASNCFSHALQNREYAENELSRSLNVLVSFIKFVKCSFDSSFLRFSLTSFHIKPVTCQFCFHAVFLKAPLEHNSEMSLSDSGFEPGGKRNFLQLTDKDGEQPQIVSVSETQNELNEVLISWHNNEKKKKKNVFIKVKKQKQSTCELK